MAKKKAKTKKLDLTKPVERPRMPISILVRMFLIGAVSIGAAAYGIYRHYYIPRPSMLMPVPAESTDLVPVPELVPLPATGDD